MSSSTPNPDGLRSARRSTFEPESILTEGEIRLFTIIPGKNDDKIEIELITVSLSDARNKYLALSYAWESTNFSHEITCNGLPLAITASLHGALWQIRKEGRPELFWVDAICIHQENIEEKTQQVRDMTSVYASAETVVIWLGPDNENTVAGLDIMQRICDAAELDVNKSRRSLDEGLGAAVFSELNLPEVTSSEWRAVGEIFKRSWFRRVWILREIQAAKQTFAVLGSVKTKTAMIIQTMVQFYKSSDLSLSLMPEEHWTIHHCSITLDSFMSLNLTGKIHMLPNLLFLARFFQCNDPRDRFFAIISCMPQIMNHIVDYQRSLEEVIMLVAEASIDCLTSTEDKHVTLFRMLSMIDSQHNNDQVPSWCPDYVGREDFVPLTPFYIGQVSSSTGNTRQSLEVDDAKRLLLNGCRKDIVASCIPVPAESRVSTIEYRVQSHSTLKRLYKSNLDYERQCHDLAMHTLTDLDIANKEEKYVNCVFLGSSEDGRPSRSESLDVLRLSWRINYAIFSFADGSTAADACALLKPFPARYQSYIESESDLNLQLFLRDELYRLTPKTSEASRVIGVAFGGRVFCSTLGHRFGMVPTISQAGDEIWVFSGWSVPFVLRPISTNPKEDGYRLIGACYIEGLMKGEGLEPSDVEELVKIV